jgi:hypothetical protein
MYYATHGNAYAVTYHSPGTLTDIEVAINQTERTWLHAIGLRNQPLPRKATTGDRTSSSMTTSDHDPGPYSAEAAAEVVDPTTVRSRSIASSSSSLPCTRGPLNQCLADTTQ